MLVYLQMIETEESKSKFRDIYREYKNLMYHIAFQRLGQVEDAEDAVQHVFMKVAEHIGKIEPVSDRTRQLMVTMVANRASDLLRARGRACTEPMADVPVQEEEGFLADCILRLPEQQRTVIWLKYYHGYSLREIAKLLDISLSSAQKIDQRAKKRLEALYLEGGGSL